MFHCWCASIFISLSQTEVESVPINQVGARREISSQLERGVLLRKTEVPQPLLGLGLWGLHPLLTDATLSVTGAACAHVSLEKPAKMPSSVLVVYQGML